MVGVAGYGEAIARYGGALPGFDKIVESLFLDESAQSDCVAPGGKPEVFDIVGRCVVNGDVDAVEDEACVGAAVESRLDVGDDSRDNDDSVGVTRSHAFAAAEHETRQTPPFGTVVIGPVVGGDDLHSEKARHRSQKSRADSVDMDNVGMQLPDFQKGEEGVDSGFEALAAWRVDRKQTDALI